MQMFVKLTHTVLRELLRDGYTVLTSVNSIDDDNPTFMPERVDNVWEWLDDFTVTSDREPAILLVENALDHLRDEDLTGAVWMAKWSNKYV